MSGIYIADMEMPTRCAECRLSTVHSFNDRPLCDVLVEYMSYGEWEAKRLDNCPLIPVPDHGRLIDADAIYDGFKKNPYSKDDLFMSVGNGGQIMRMVNSMFAVFRKTLQDAPTIIPSDHSGDVTEKVPKKEGGD